MTRAKRVSIVYRFLPHYRVDFFAGLRRELAARGVELDLVYGVDERHPEPDDHGLDWAERVPNRTLRIGGQRFIWQPLPPRVAHADLVVLMQESRLLRNHALLARGVAGRTRVAFWGHGINFELDARSAANRLKLAYSKLAHWWFAYTDGVAQTVAATGFPSERVTVVRNAIDTRSLVREAARADLQDVSHVRAALGIGPGPVGIYCGRLHAQKRVGDLLYAVRRIRDRIPGFEMIVLGAGPDAASVETFAAEYPWLHFVGPKVGLDRVPYFRAADVFLLPGAVGLAVLDAFALGTPIVTRDLRDHGPEIEYLRHRENGVVAAEAIDDFVDASVEVLTTPALRGLLADGCRTSAARYSIENMVENFADGVDAALRVPLRR